MSLCVKDAADLYVGICMSKCVCMSLFERGWNVGGCSFAKLLFTIHSSGVNSRNIPTISFDLLCFFANLKLDFSS